MPMQQKVATLLLHSTRPLQGRQHMQQQMDWRNLTLHSAEQSLSSCDPGMLPVQPMSSELGLGCNPHAHIGGAGQGEEVQLRLAPLHGLPQPLSHAL
jgi:hypothetical protein